MSLKQQPKAPPYSVEAEQAVLGGLMLDNRTWDDIGDKLGAEDFYREDHRLIFGALAELSANRKPCDFVTVCEHLKAQSRLEDAGGLAYLGTLANDTPSAANVVAYAEIVRERAVLRALIATGGEIAEMGFRPEGRAISELVELAEQRVYAVRESGKKRTDTAADLADLIPQVEADIERLQRGESFSGLRTGFCDIDEKINGLRPGQLIIVAGRPGMGKTTIALNIADYVSANGGSALVFSLEMPAKELAMRSLASAASVSVDSIIKGRLNSDEQDAIAAAGGELRRRKLTIDEAGGLSPFDVRARARRHASRKGLDLVVVDYLQLMQVPAMKGNRVNEISEISRSLKALAKDLHVPIIALSQLNRGVENRENKRPRMADLRESGSIEQDADVILFTYRDEEYNPESADKGTAEIIIGKQRNGPTGMVRLAYAGHHCRFSNLAPGWKPETPTADEPPPQKRGFGRGASHAAWSLGVEA